MLPSNSIVFLFCAASINTCLFNTYRHFANEAAISKCSNLSLLFIFSSAVSRYFVYLCSSRYDTREVIFCYLLLELQVLLLKHLLLALVGSYVDIVFFSDFVVKQPVTYLGKDNVLQSPLHPFHITIT
jgi:hypothetical protein